MVGATDHDVSVYDQADNELAMGWVMLFMSGESEKAIAEIRAVPIAALQAFTIRNVARTAKALSGLGGAQGA